MEFGIGDTKWLHLGSCFQHKEFKQMARIFCSDCRQAAAWAASELWGQLLFQMHRMQCLYYSFPKYSQVNSFGGELECHPFPCPFWLVSETSWCQVHDGSRSVSKGNIITMILPSTIGHHNWQPCHFLLLLPVLVSSFGVSHNRLGFREGLLT